ncbi:MAG: PatB family C-S lyase [Moraxellaceae bacterium]|nr:PatB family C-S lyase [Moraxellaceae bacterium]
MTPSSVFDTLVDRRGSDSIKWAKYANRRAADGREILPLWVADMDFAAPPAVQAALAARIAHGVFGYGHTTAEFTQTLIDALNRDYGWAVEAECIVPLPGLVAGLNIAARSIGETGDAIVTATPVYPALFTASRHMDRECITVPLDEARHWGWDMAALTAAHTPRTRGLFLCHPHNPGGRVWSAAELDAIADHARQHDLVVVSDEIHCDLILEPGLRHRPFALQAPDLAAHSITLMAPSKTYNIPGLGVAFAIIPGEALRRRFYRAMAGIVPHVNILGMAATIAAYRDSTEWRAALLDYLRANRDAVMQLDGVGGLRVIRPEATYLAWLDCRDTALADPVATFEQGGIGLSPGRDFGRERFVRLNFGCPRATLDDALARMRQVLTL